MSNISNTFPQDNAAIVQIDATERRSVLGSSLKATRALTGLSAFPAPARSSGKNRIHARLGVYYAKHVGFNKRLNLMNMSTEMRPFTVGCC